MDGGRLSSGWLASVTDRRLNPDARFRGSMLVEPQTSVRSHCDERMCLAIGDAGVCGSGTSKSREPRAMMSAMAAARLGLLAAGVVAAGCGSSAATRSARANDHPQPAPPTGAGSPTGPRTRSIPVPTPSGVPADPAAVRVIRAWSNALRRGNVRSAASYFALPSRFINGPDSAGEVAVIAIHTLRQAEAVNASLPCGAQFMSADQRGRYVNALFRLTDRPGPGGGCGPGIGQLARTNFVIAGGRISEWIRAPNDPGDNGRGGSPPGPLPPRASPIV